LGCERRRTKNGVKMKRKEEQEEEEELFNPTSE